MRFLRVLTSLILVLSTSLVSALALPVHLRGIRQTRTGSDDNRKDGGVTWREQIAWLDAQRTMFTQVLLKLEEAQVGSPEFKVRERQHTSRWSRLAEELTNAETGIDVPDSRMFRVNDIVLIVETGEKVHVTAIPSATEITVTRGALGTTAAATTLGTSGWLKILFSKVSEGSGKPSYVTTDTTTSSNFAQQFKSGYGQTGDEKANKTNRSGWNLQTEQKLALERMREDMEQAFLWGTKREEVSSGVITRYTGGMNEFVTSNRIDLEGGLGFGDIGYLMNVASRWGSPAGKKIWLCGRDARQQLDTLGLEYLQVGPKDNFMGMAVEKIRSSHGEAMLLTHHGLDNGHAGYIFVIDPNHVRIANYREIELMKNVENNDIDGEEHYYMTSKGLWYDTELSHMVITGVTAKVT